MASSRRVPQRAVPPTNPRNATPLVPPGAAALSSASRSTKLGQDAVWSLSPSDTPNCRWFSAHGKKFLQRIVAPGPERKNDPHAIADITR